MQITPLFYECLVSGQLFSVVTSKTLIPSADGFSSEGHRKVKRTRTNSIAGIGGVFISCRKKMQSVL